MPFRAEYCIICEGVRPETGGKATILGFFGLAPNVEILLGNMQSPLQITFMIGIGVDDVARQYAFSARLSGPNGNIFLQTPATPIQTSATGRGVTAFGIAAQFPLQGRYSLQVMADGASVFQTQFAIRQARPEELAGATGRVM